MAALTSPWPWPRGFLLTAVAAPLVLAVAAVPIYWFVGPIATIVLLASGGVLLLVMLTMSAGRRLQRANDGRLLGERALDTVPQAIFVVDALRSGTPNRYVNPAYSALTGYGAAEAVAAGFDATSIFADYASIARLRDSAAERVDVLHRDGTTYQAKLELRAVARGDGGRYTLGMIEKLDAGEKPADSKLQPFTDTPAAAADSAPRPKDAFLSSLSHDLRSPLNACVMWLDVLALAPAPDKLTKAVEAIKRNLARQTRIVNDLNDAAKISSDGLEVRLAPLDLVALLQGHLDAWQLLAIGKQLAFHHHIEPETARIDADPERLLQALNHLLDSALMSTPSGGRIELRVRSERGVCILELTDTGIALSAEDAANLGLPLWRAPASARARSGLGLGLAIAHHFVSKHGGTLLAQSGGTGAHFTLTLPLLAGTDDEQTDALGSEERAPL